jgi:GEVED domain/CARDB/Domain of unknown function DUF11/Secretion system C-terminal sorting domain
MKIRNLYPFNPERIGMSCIHILLILTTFLAQLGFAQNSPMLVKDINVGAGSSDPQDFIVSGNKLRFSTRIINNQPVNQSWESDGTANGTVTNNSLLNSTTSFKGNSYSFFNQNDTVTLLKTSATNVQTVVKVLPKFNNYSYRQIYVANDLFYFIATFADTTGLCCGYTDTSIALWRSDGTAAGTSQIAVIARFVTRSTNNFSFGRTSQNTFYYQMQESEVYQALYACDGTAASIRQIDKVQYPINFELLNTDNAGNLFYRKASIGAYSILKYNGSQSTTLATSNAPLSIAGASATSATVLSSYEAGLWLTDGTPSGTKRVLDGNVLYQFRNTAGKLLAVQKPSQLSAATYLWQVTESGSTQLNQLVTGITSSEYLAIGNTLYFRNTEASTGAELWKQDLTAPLTSPCASKGTLPWEYWVSNVKLGSINNTSDKFKDFNTLGYSDYTSLTTTLSKGQSYPLSISPGLSWIGNVPNAYVRAWIDFNDNKTFEANELVLEKNNANPLITSVLVPTTAVTGNVRMRVSVKFGSYPTACETFDKGEVEDYIVNITTANSNCPNIKFSLPSAFGDRTEYVPSNQTCKEVYWVMPHIIDSCVGLASERALLHSSVSNNIFIDYADFLSWACFPIGTTTVSYNYGGNIYSFKVTVIQQSNDLPDLTLANLNLTNPSVPQGQNMDFSVDAKNIGTANAPNSTTIKPYLSLDQTLDASDVSIGTIILPVLNADGSTNTTQGGFSTSSLALGSYYLILKIDPNNLITESNENNNIIVSTSFTVAAVQTGAYCASKGTLPWEYWVGNVKFNTLNNASDKFKDFATLGYSDYTNISTTVSKGQSYPLSISPGLSWIGNVPNAYARVWIDFNNNKTFEANELVLEKTNANPLISNVLIPTTAVTGAVRMRLSVKFGSYPTACEVFDKGEVEDYTIDIQGTAVDPCLADVTPPVFSNCPQNMSFIDIAATCRTFNWTPPTVTDNCTTTPSVSFVFKGGSTVSTQSATSITAQVCRLDTVVYTAKDARGNTSTCQFELKVIDQCQVPQTTNPVPQDTILTTVGNCAPFKWRSPSFRLGCNFGPAPDVVRYYSLLSTVPNVNVVRIPPTCQYCSDGQDSVCFPIGTTVLTYDVPNGKKTFTVTVNRQTVILPDMTLSNLNFITPSVSQGASMFYSFEFKNIGTAPAPNALIAVYISSDNVLSSDDVVVNNYPEIPAGTTSFQASSFVPTATVAVGSYYLILKVDANNQIAESNENNNVLVSATKFTVTNGVNNSCRQQDSLQLVALYNATGGANWQTKWDLSKPITSWYGLSFIQFANDNCLRVQKVLLDYNNLVGTIPNLNIPPLRELRLVGNKLTGAIPNFNLPNLEELYLNSNQLTGSVPNLTLPNLVKLELGDNQLTGTIPNLNLPNLEILGFAKNQLTGTVPNLNLPKLKYWYLETNLFTSVADLTLPNLELLYLDGNRLSGNVPNLNLLPKIYAFSLGNNQLTGNIPNFSQSTLQYMTLSANKLSGSIPNFNLPNIRQIYLANNQLSGTLPNFNQVPNLSLLNVSDNRLSGCLPSSLIAFCGNAFLLGNNPNLATQDFNAFCTLGTGACPADIALSITSTPSVFSKYTTQIFKIKAQNVGNQALTNVKIEFKRPAQTSNGGAKVASVGTFNDFCPGGIECSEWTIPTLAAGATATLDAPVFILDPTTAIVATTKLLTSIPVDGNAANNSASVTLTPAAPAPAIQSLSRQKPTQYLPIVVQSIAPNPTEGDVVIEVESLKEQTVQFEFSNTMGQTIRTEKRPLEKGTNQVKFDVYEFPDGVYLIQTDVNRGRFTPTKFVKF